MAYLYRLILSTIVRRVVFVVVALIFATITQCVHAETAASSPRYALASYPQGGVYADRNALIPVWNAYAYPTAAFSVASFSCANSAATSCTATRVPTSGGSGTTITINFSVTWVCPTGSNTTSGSGATMVCTYTQSCTANQTRDPVTGACWDNNPTCPSGQVYDANTHACRNECMAGKTLDYGSSQTVKGGNFPTSICMGGCTYSVIKNSFIYCETCNGTGETGGTTTLEMGNGTGAFCESNDISSLDQAKKDCLAKGGSYGSINGVTQCVPAGTNGTPPVTTKDFKTDTTTDASGTTTKTSTTSQTSTDGNVKTTTTTTTMNPDGSTTTSTNTKDQSKASFCQENADSNICKSTSFGGNCGAFTCNGDGVQCAIAEEQHKRNCTLYETETSMSTLGKQITEGNDPEGSANPSKAANRTLINLPSTLDASNPLGGNANGLSDFHTTYKGYDIKIPFSDWNPYLVIMGYIVLAFAYVSAGRIVGVW